MDTNRKALLFSLDALQRRSADDSDDSFFTVTVNDLKVMLRDLTTQTAGLDEAPLLTKKMREMDDANKTLLKLTRYKSAVIRIQFPDRLVLQATFAPIDTIGTVMQFVRTYLARPEMEFYLCKLIFSKSSIRNICLWISFSCNTAKADIESR